VLSSFAVQSESFALPYQVMDLALTSKTSPRKGFQAEIKISLQLLPPEKDGQSLRFALLQQKRKQDGDWGSYFSCKLHKSQIANYAYSEQEFLHLCEPFFVGGKKEKFRGRESILFSEISVPIAFYSFVLLPLARDERLLWNNEQLNFLLLEHAVELREEENKLRPYLCGKETFSSWGKGIFLQDQNLIFDPSLIDFEFKESWPCQTDVLIPLLREFPLAHVVLKKNLEKVLLKPLPIVKIDFTENILDKQRFTCRLYFSYGVREENEFLIQGRSLFNSVETLELEYDRFSQKVFCRDLKKEQGLISELHSLLNMKGSSLSDSFVVESKDLVELLDYVFERGFKVFSRNKEVIKVDEIFWTENADLKACCKGDEFFIDNKIKHHFVAPQEEQIYFLREPDFQSVRLWGDLSHDSKDSLKKLLLLGEEGEIFRETPDSLFRGQLRTYQQQGFSWLRLTQKMGLGALMADDMGLGKTIQLIAFLASCIAAERKEGKVCRHLIVVPKSLVYNWQKEIEKFFGTAKTYIYQGPQRQHEFENFRPEITVISYSLCLRDFSFLKDYEFETVILDEAQYIKNRKSRLSRSIKKLSKKHGIALSGTPIENNLLEYFSIMEFLNPFIGKRFQKFSDISDYGEGIKIFFRLLAPLVLRRTKEEVLTELPAKNISEVWIGMEEEQEELYQRIKMKMRNKAQEQISQKGFKAAYLNVLEAILRMRQMANHPALVDLRFRQAASAKTSHCLSFVKRILGRGEKVLVFSQFRSMLHLLKEEFDKINLPVFLLDGQTQDRQKLVDEFNNRSEPAVFLISLKAGGVGLNLTSANHCILFDPWWNPALESQAMDRIHRMGQQEKVWVYKFLTKNSVEEKVLALQETKKELSQYLETFDMVKGKMLTSEQIDFLFS